MAARYRRILACGLLTAVTSLTLSGCSTTYDRAYPPTYGLGPEAYPIKLSPAPPDRPAMSQVISRPPADTADSKPSVAPVGYPQNALHAAPKASGPAPAPPPELQPPPESPRLVVKEAPPPAPIMLAMMDFVENRPDRAIDALQGCPQTNQQLLMRLLPLVAYLSDPKVDANDPATAKRVWEQLDGVKSIVVPPLAIDKMCFCKDVKSFGCYEMLPPNHEFCSATEEHGGERACVYLELRNLTAHQKEQFFQSAIFSRISIFDSEENEAFRQEDEDAVFQTRSQRNDVYLECRFEVPRKIPPGTYKLVIEIRDKLTKPQHIAKKSIEMRIGN